MNNTNSDTRNKGGWGMAWIAEFIPIRATHLPELNVFLSTAVNQHLFEQFICKM
jgi:hypothetical protein